MLSAEGSTLDPSRLQVFPGGEEERLVGKIQVEEGTGRLSQVDVVT